MTSEQISIQEYCRYHHTEVSFIDALEQGGLIRVIVTEEQRCIDFDQLETLESFTRWYYDLDINVEGIEVIQHLLQKVKDQQAYIRSLEEQLKPAGE